MTCMLCEGGNDPLDVHTECAGERRSRQAVGKCTRCGSAPAMRGYYICGDCEAADDPPFLGDPGAA